MSDNTITGDTNTITGATSSTVTGDNSLMMLTTDSATIGVTDGVGNPLAGLSATDTQVDVGVIGGGGMTVSGTGANSSVTVTTADGDGLAVDQASDTTTLTSDNANVELTTDSAMVGVTGGASMTPPRPPRSAPWRTRHLGSPVLSMGFHSSCWPASSKS